MTNLRRACREHQKPIKPLQLVDELDMNLRSVRYALKILSELDLVERQPDLEDLRTYFYFVKDNEFDNAKKLVSL